MDLNIITDKYIYPIKISKWYKILKLPKLSLESINKVNDRLTLMYLYCIFGYSEQLFNFYSKEELLSNKYIDNYRTSLFQFSILFGHFSIMKKLYKMGININYYTNGYSPYNLSAMGGNLKILMWLEEKKYFNYTEETWFEEDALLNGCVSGNVDLIKYLIQKGADINNKNCLGNNAYLIACFFGNFPLVKYLESININKKKSRNFIGTSHKKYKKIL